MTPERYAEQLDALLPQGQAWPREPGSRLHALTRALAEEFARVEARADALLSEALPATTLEMLEDWERVTGLPDPCVTESQTIQERRNAMLARLTSAGGQSREFFISLAECLGFTITITEFHPFRAGRSSAGDAACSVEWRHAWRVNAPETTVISFRAGQSAAGEPLRKWGNELLECVFNRVKPAHTVLLFGYGG